MLNWLTNGSLALLGAALFAAMVAVAWGGLALRGTVDRRGKGGEHNDTQEGYLVSAVLSLLALLIGFTFALAVDRYEVRRLLVVDDANAIERLYLQAQLLDQPHRGRIGDLLVRYTENHIDAAEAQSDEARILAREGDRLTSELWAAVIPAFDSVRGIDFSSTFADSANQLVEVGASRWAAREARIPGAVFAVLFLYIIAAAGVLGYVLHGRRARAAAAVVLALFTIALMLLSDLNRPTSGTIRESQAPMERLLAVLRANPPQSFERSAPVPGG